MLYKLYSEMTDVVSFKAVNKKGFYVVKEGGKIDFVGPQGKTSIGYFEKAYNILEAGNGTFLLEANDAQGNARLYGTVLNQKTTPVIDAINSLYVGGRNNKDIIGVKDGFIYYFDSTGKLKKYDYLAGQETTIGSAPDLYRNSSYNKVFVSNNILVVFYFTTKDQMNVAYYNLSDSAFELSVPRIVHEMTPNKYFEPGYNDVDEMLELSDKKIVFTTTENGISSIRSYDTATSSLSLIDEGNTVYDYKDRKYIIGRLNQSSEEVVSFTSLLENKTIYDAIGIGKAKMHISQLSNIVHCFTRRRGDIGEEMVYSLSEDGNSTREINVQPFSLYAWQSIREFNGGAFDGLIYGIQEGTTFKVMFFSYAGENTVKELFPTAELVSGKPPVENENAVDRVQIGDISDILNDMHLFDENFIEDIIQTSNELYIITAQRNANEQTLYRLFKQGSSGLMEIPYIKHKVSILYKNTEKKIHVYKTDGLNYIAVRFDIFSIVNVTPGDLKSISLQTFINTKFPSCSIEEKFNFEECEFENGRFLLFYSEYVVYPSSDLGPSEDNIVYRAKIPHVYDLNYSLQDGDADTIILPPDNSPSGYARKVIVDEFSNIIIAYELQAEKSVILKFNLISFSKVIAVSNIDRGEFKFLQAVGNKILYSIRVSTEIGVFMNKHYIGTSLILSHADMTIESVRFLNNVCYFVFKGTESGTWFSRFYSIDISLATLTLVQILELPSVFETTIFNINTLEFYCYNKTNKNIYKISLDGTYLVAFSYSDVVNALSQMAYVQGFYFKFSSVGIKICVTADNIKFPIELEYDSGTGFVTGCHSTVNVHFTMLEIFIYYPPSVALDEILIKYPVIKTEDVDWTDRPRKEVYGVQGMLDAKPGDICYLGSLYYNNNGMPFPKAPYLNGDVNNFANYNDMSKWELGDSITGDEIRWVKVNNNMLIADRPLLMNVSYRTLHQYNWVRGKTVQIDGREFKVRAMTGGNMAKLTPELYYSGGLPLDNEWDLYIGNRANLGYLPMPTSSDLQNSLSTANYQSNHNSFWNWSKMFSLCYEFVRTDNPMNEGICLRGFNSSMYWKPEESVALNEHIAYRPVLVIDPMQDNMENNINSPSQITSVKVEDNKFSWEVNVVQYNITNVKSQIVIFDQTGKIVKIGNIKLGLGSKVDVIDITNLTEGVYTWKIKTVADQFPETWSKPFMLTVSREMTAKLKILLPDGEDYDLVWMLTDMFSVNNEIRLFMNDLEVANNLHSKEVHELNFDDFSEGLTKITLRLFKSNVQQGNKKEINVLKLNGEMTVLNNVYISKEILLGEIPKMVSVNAELSYGFVNTVFVSINGGIDFKEIPPGRMTDVTNMVQGDKLKFIISYPVGARILSLDYSWE